MKRVLTVGLMAGVTGLGHSVQGRSDGYVDRGDLPGGLALPDLWSNAWARTCLNDGLVTVGDFAISGSVSDHRKRSAVQRGDDHDQRPAANDDECRTGNNLAHLAERQRLYAAYIAPGLHLRRPRCQPLRRRLRGCARGLSGMALMSTNWRLGFPPAGSTPSALDCCTLAAGTGSCSAPDGTISVGPGAVSILDDHADDVHHSDASADRLVHLERPGEHHARAGTRLDAASRHRPLGRRALWTSPVQSGDSVGAGCDDFDTSIQATTRAGTRCPRPFFLAP